MSHRPAHYLRTILGCLRPDRTGKHLPSPNAAPLCVSEVLRLKNELRKAIPPLLEKEGVLDGQAIVRHLRPRFAAYFDKYGEGSIYPILRLLQTERMVGKEWVRVPGRGGQTPVFFRLRRGVALLLPESR